VGSVDTREDLHVFAMRQNKLTFKLTEHLDRRSERNLMRIHLELPTKRSRSCSEAGPELCPVYEGRKETNYEFVRNVLTSIEKLLAARVAHILI
jgi:hypothetical protein